MPGDNYIDILERDFNLDNKHMARLAHTISSENCEKINRKDVGEGVFVTLYYTSYGRYVWIDHTMYQGFIQEPKPHEERKNIRDCVTTSQAKILLTESTHYLLNLDMVRWLEYTLRENAS